MRIIPLGTAGFFPSDTRETASFLVIGQTTALLLDAGTGVRRLAQDDIREALVNISELHVLISHLHHDHICGLTWLLRLWQRKLILHIPQQPLIAADGVAGISAIIDQPFFSRPLSDWPQKPDVVPMNSTSVQCNEFSLNLLPQKHLGGSVGFRIGDDFAYVTDTFVSPEHRDFLAGVSMLFIDTMHDWNDYQAIISSGGQPDHGNSIDNAKLAGRVGTAQLGLIHLDPLYKPDRLELLLQEAQQYFPAAFIPLEGTEYVL